MKKTLFLWMCLFFLCTSLFSQTSVTIGTGTSTSYYPLPGFWGWNYEAQLYTASEINIDAGGSITSIGYNLSAALSTSENKSMKIYMMETSASVLDATVISSWNGIQPQATLVYEAPNSALAFTEGWNIFTLDNPFQYDGTSNLLILIEGVGCTTGGGCGGDCIYYSTSTTNKCWYYRKDTSAPTGNEVGTFTSSNRANIKLDIIEFSLSCPRVTDLAVSNISGSSANLSWTAGGTETQWFVSHKTASTDWSAESVLDNPTYPMTSLAELTTYQVRVRAYCGVGDTSNYRVTSFTTFLDPSTIPFTEDFETPTTWQLLNGTQTNKWVINTAPAANDNDGLQCLYISNTSTSTPPAYAYSHTTSHVYAIKYLDFEIGDHLISYDWKNRGESASYDRIQVWLAPVDATITAGSSPTTTGWTRLHSLTGLSGQTTWQEEELVVSIPTEGTYKLVIYWYNDGSGGSQPPGAIDNIQIQKLTCSAPVALTVANETPFTADISWEEAGDATQWLLSYKASSESEWSDEIVITPDPEYTISGLTGATNYEVRVRSFCQEGDTSFYTSVSNFTTLISCPAPSNLAVETATITQSSATVNWQSPALPPAIGFEEYTLEYKMSAQSWEEATPINNIADTFYNITELNASTSYNVRVKINCTDDPGSTWITANFSTDCGTITSFPWNEGFEDPWVLADGSIGDKAAPLCWTVVDRGGIYNDDDEESDYWWSRSSSTSFAHSGSASAQCYTDYGVEDHNDWLITPQLSLTANERLRFWARRATATTGEPDEISIFISDEGITLSTEGMGTYDTMPGFHRIFHQLIPSGAWQRYEVNLSAYSGNRYIAFVRQGTPDGYYLRLDDVSVETLPSCLPPHTISTSEIAETSVKINFTPGNATDNAWRLYFKPVSATEWDSAEVAVTPFVLEQLASSTPYEYYLKTNCGSDLSEETNTYTFTTACGDIAVLPWTESFDSYGLNAFPPCMTKPLAYGNYPWTVTTNSSPPYSLYFQSNLQTIAVTPRFVAEATTLMVTFKLRREGTSSGTFEVGVMTDPNDASTFTLVQSYDQSNHSTWEEFELFLSTAEVTGAHYIAFKQNATASNWYYWLDDIEVKPLPACPRPNEITVNPLATSATATWIPIATEDQWLVSHKTAAATEWGDETLVNEPSYPMSSLAELTAYEVRVRAYCGVGDTSDYRVTSFSTILDPSTIPFTEEFETPTTWQLLNGTQTNQWVINTAPEANDNDGTQCLYISNAPTATPPSYAYSHTTSHVYAIKYLLFETGDHVISYDWKNQGESANYDRIQAWLAPFNATINAGSSPTTTGWTRLHTLTGLSGQPTWQEEELVVTIPTEGIYKLVFYWYNDGTGGSQPPAAIDNVHIQKLTCSAPLNLAVTDPTLSSLDVTWSSASDATQWLISHKKSTETAWGNETLVTPDPEFTINGLDASTSYNIRVRALCGVGDTSLYSYANGQTSCGIITSFPWSEGFEEMWVLDPNSAGDKDAPPCWTVVDKGGTYSTYQYWWKRSTTTHTGSGAAQCYTDYGTTDHNDWLISPEIAMTGDLSLRFWAQRNSSTTSEPDEISVFISDEDITLTTVGMGTYDDMPGFELIFNQLLPVGPWAEYEVPLTGYSGNRYIAFVRQGTPDGYYLRLDDVTIFRSCSPITDLNATLNGNDIALTWTAPAGNPTGYEIYFNGNLLTTVTGTSYNHLTVPDGIHTYTVKAIFENDDCTPLGVEVQIQKGTPCEVIIEMEDEFGDGWNGARIDVYQNSTVIASAIFTDGENATATVLIFSGEAEFVWVAGSFDDECSFTIHYEGEEIYASTGEPTAGTFFTWECGVPCPSVTNIVVMTQGSTAIITWDAPSEGTPSAYKIYLDNVEVEEVPFGTNEYTLTWLENGDYTVAIAAIYSSEYNCIPQKTPSDFTISSCPSPSDLRAVYIVETCHARLSWLAPGDKAPDTYNIYRDGVLIASDIEEVEYIDTELVATEAHTWEVEYICNDGGTSDKISTNLPRCSDGVESYYFNDLTISPNPATSFVTISGAVISKIEIYNAMGQLISTQIDNVNTVNVSLFSSGVYLFKLYNADNESAVRRVVIAK